MPIVLENVSYTYGKNTPFEKKALDCVSFDVADGESVGIIGSTGSGKSTLVQHLNGLIKLQSGKIAVDGTDLSAKKPDLNGLRKKVGMLFQYPEYQLFAETVREDVMFGPLNFGMGKEDAERAAENAVRLVGLDYENIKNRSPIELSGGQKRRVAIAGVLAYGPSILVLDEPTGGLDPAGKTEMLELIRSLQKNGAVKTVVTVSHNMDEIAAYCDRVIVLHNSRLVCDSTPADFFYNYPVPEFGLSYPHAVAIVRLLEKKGVILPHTVLTEKDLVKAVYARFSAERGGAL
jgi:energy-coupling factor transport system ATP-binding protein